MTAKMTLMHIIITCMYLLNKATVLNCVLNLIYCWNQQPFIECNAECNALTKIYVYINLSRNNYVCEEKMKTNFCMINGVVN